MTTKLLLASLAATTLGVSAAVLPASAQEGVSPVAVVGCAVNVTQDGPYGEGAGESVVFAAMYRVANATRIAASPTAPIT